MSEAKMFCCTSCGTEGEASCDCGASYDYLKPGKRAKLMLGKHPDWSDRKIAEAAGVNVMTIGRARKSTVTNVTVEKRAGKDGKARKQPKPRQPKPVKTPDERGRVAGVDITNPPEEWKKFNDMAADEGKSASTKIEELIHDVVEPEITRDMLSLSAQEKFDAAVRRELNRLTREHDDMVRKHAQRLIEDTILPSYNQSKAEYDTLVKFRKGLLTKAEYNLIRACLHPDNSMTGDKRQRAWDLFSKLEIPLLDESQHKTSNFEIPKTYDGLMAMRRKRAAAQSGNSSLKRR